ncbi:MAG: hypothetical protein H6Q04_1933 [Acidobacteria bacterium]|jgi:hypothetical protein|nr:hypothetical protein [Acidobacteriota bacterium]
MGTVMPDAESVLSVESPFAIAGEVSCVYAVTMNEKLPMSSVLGSHKAFPP